MSRSRTNRRFRRKRSGLRRLGDLLATLAMLGLLTIVVARMPATPPTETLQGPAWVVDGDSLMLGGVRIRLKGIDAPELDQICENNGVAYQCGRQAREALAKLVGGGGVTCDSYGHDRYGRTLARCRIGATQLNRAMVETGWAVAYGDYEAQEAQARKAGRGIWRGNFMQPQEWRRAHDGPVETRHDWFADFRNWLRERLGFLD